MGLQGKGIQQLGSEIHEPKSLWEALGAMPRCRAVIWGKGMPTQMWDQIPEHGARQGWPGKDASVFSSQKKGKEV